jgi:RNA polymerase sigma factor (sigma-70 family)
MNKAAAPGLKDSFTDEEIIARVLAGETALYEQIMRRYNATLYRVGMSIVNNDMVIEDIMQVTYIKAYEHLKSFENRSSFRTWLTRIMINESLHELKKRKRYMSVEVNDDKTMPDAYSDHQMTPVGKLMNKELGKILEDALVQLPEKYRIVFVLREMEQRSIAETVDTLNITEANVKVRLNRAKSLLRDTLGGYYKNDGIFQFHLSRCDRVVNNVMRHINP